MGRIQPTRPAPAQAALPALVALGAAWYRARSHHPPRFTAALARPRSACAAEAPRRKAQARPDWEAGLGCHASLSGDVWGGRAHAGGVATRRGFLLGHSLLEAGVQDFVRRVSVAARAREAARQPTVQAQSSDPLFFPDCRSTEGCSESRARVLVLFWSAGLKFLGLRRGLGSTWRFGGCPRRLRTSLRLCLAQAHLVLFFLGATWILALVERPVPTVSNLGSLDPLCGRLAYLQVGLYCCGACDLIFLAWRVLGGGRASSAVVCLRLWASSFPGTLGFRRSEEGCSVPGAVFGIAEANTRAAVPAFLVDRCPVEETDQNSPVPGRVRREARGTDR